jgi:hypothetical protein
MRPLLSVTVVWLATACTVVLGIDGEYELAGTGGSNASGGDGEPDADVPVQTGGRTNTGGASGSGGTGGVGAGGEPEAGSCGPGTKLCPDNFGELACIEPNTAVGCGASGCDPCVPPPNEVATGCVDGECKFECRLNFERIGTMCEPVAGGGGSPGTGGGGPTSCRVGMDADCPRCSQTVPGCCAIAPNPGTCGCWAVWCVSL